MRRYATTTKLEWPGRVVNAGEIVGEDEVPEQSLAPLVEQGALEPYDAKTHGDGWYTSRRDAEIERVFVEQGVRRIPASDRFEAADLVEIADSDQGRGRDKR